jgi:thiamine pyrophosphokinase
MAAQRASDTVVVVTGGDPVALEHLAIVPAGALVIAADSGIEHAHALGLTVDVALGDFDSVSPAALQRAVDGGAIVERHPEAKDATDLELALDAALVRGARRVLVLGGHGGRLDHLLGNLALLASPRFVALTLDAWVGTARVNVVRTDTAIVGEPGSLVSLFAMHGPAHGVTTRGLRFPLHDAVLEPGSTLGISNELTVTEAGVRLDAGVLLTIQPNALPSDARLDEGGP